MNDHDFFDGVQPENDLPEDAPIERRSLRFKALLLLVILLIPAFLIIFEIATGQISLFWEETIRPILPQIDNIVIF